MTGTPHDGDELVHDAAGDARIAVLGPLAEEGLGAMGHEGPPAGAGESPDVGPLV